MIAAGVISGVQVGIGAYAMSKRKMFSTSEFHNKKEIVELQQEHKKVFGTDINELGYPDMGNGRYADQLSYKEWVEFNNAQRSHYDMVENSGLALPCLVLNGLFRPALSAGLGAAYAIGRLLYGVGYQAAGANGRYPGALVSGIGSFGLYGLSIFYGLRNFDLV